MTREELNKALGEHPELVVVDLGVLEISRENEIPDEEMVEAIIRKFREEITERVKSL